MLYARIMLLLGLYFTLATSINLQRGSEMKNSLQMTSQKYVELIRAAQQSLYAAKYEKKREEYLVEVSYYLHTGIPSSKFKLI